MKSSTKILSTFATLLMTACGVVDQKEIHRNKAENSYSQEKGLSLTGTDFETFGSAIGISSSANSLSCPADGDNSGIVSINSFDFTNNDVTLKLNIDIGSSLNHTQKIKIEGSEHVYLRLFKWGNTYQIKAGKNNSDLVHYSMNNGIKYLKMSHSSGIVRYYHSDDGSTWTEFGNTLFSATSDMKLSYECGTTASTISDVTINNEQQSLDLNSGGLSSDMIITGSGSNMTSTTNSLTCPADGDNSGMESASSFDFADGSITAKLDIDVGEGSLNHEQYFGLEGPGGNLYLRLFKWGNNYQVKARHNTTDIVHTDYGSSNIKYLKIDNNAAVNRITFYTSNDGSSWTSFGNLTFSDTSNMKLIYDCGATASTISDVKINDIAQNIDVVGGGASDGSSDSGTTTDGSSDSGTTTDGSSDSGTTTDGSGGGGSSNDMVLTGSGSNMASTTNSLTCPADGDNSGMESASSFDFTNGSITAKLDIDVGGSLNHEQYFGLEGPGGNLYLRLFKWGNNYQVKARYNSTDLAHTDYGSSNIKYFKIANNAAVNRITFYTSIDGSNWTSFSNLTFSDTSSMKLIYDCGTTASTISDVKIDDSLQNIDVVSGGTTTDGSGGGTTTDGSDGGATTDGSDGGATTDGSGGSGSSNEMLLTGSGSNMTSTTNSLTCPADGDNSGMESASSFDFTDGSITAKLDIDVGGSLNHAQYFGVEGPGGNLYIRLFKNGNNYQVKSRYNATDVAHTNYGSSNIKYFKIAHHALHGRVTFYTSIDGSSWTSFSSLTFTDTSSMKLIYDCGTTASTISDVKIDDLLQNIDVVSGGTTTDGSDGGTTTDGSDGGTTTDGSGGGTTTDGSSDGSTDGSSGGGSGSGSVNIADHPNYSYVLKAHNFFQSQKVQSTANPSVYTMKTYDAGGVWANAADVYDNGLAAIAYLVMGRATDAGQILSSYLQIYQGLEDWGNSVGQEKRLLTQRIYPTTLMPNNEIEPPAEDLGNNSYMVLAFCKYFNQYLNDVASMEQLLPYYDRAYKVLDYIWRTRLRTNGTHRFLGRDTAGYASTEHHINLYAFGKCMARTVPPGYDATLINNFTNVADNFVRAMWDDAVGAYRLGTVNDANSDAINYEDGFPADTASWRYMSGAGFRSITDDARSLDWLTSTSGTWVVETAFGISNFAGVRFTSNVGAYGQQTENTGAALAALKMHGAYSSKASQIENSLKALFDQRGDGGLPAHKDSPSGPQCCNTGLSWSYFNVPHLASTAYSILGIIGENPYQTEPSSYVRVQPVIIP